ncbi:similar to Saccharomyces cerevisiae YHR107C CDC12 Component of the septin ring of the mother-bud neck that is required for cytokinesis [Maudiozyma saulgeensis]|uniref:Similar to Saccharomyces cerevisiae YHR107C CDC12 Component of the septin ring of the mother-bud neck that is required for cytokinesis n=1 Tax=Maudiozyma saulgeensis TaxID=1789683 RepID=A0A1X7QXD7_9SACH|nr:similar to Saccharomyces cerevisiae YHR107C CDC12 Component of the septin ring of the mother-bud neck that is required for cytokinesis [Kazachstania saulgeensis]
MTTQSVGVANLPNQRYKIVSEKGGTFTIMVCGESGLGKTTFINTLFQTTLKHADPQQRRHLPLKKTVDIDLTRAVLEEKNFKMRVNVIDTPGFGDNVNNNKAWQTLVDFIDDQHDSYMRQEQQPHRDVKFDLRVHVVLYFIKPTGHGLKPLDIETMKKISSRANLIPVIAKSDTLTLQELQVFKSRIRQVIEAQEIHIFTPPLNFDTTTNINNNTESVSAGNSATNQDATAAEHARQLIEAMPFAIIGSTTKYDNGQGTQVVARKYPWGLVEVENDNHCDFRKLRSMLLRTYLLDLITSTQDLHYETYRRLRLEGTNGPDNEDNSNGNGDSSMPLKAPARKLSHNPKYKEEENALKKYFTDQVKAEEQRFRQWEQNIVNERIRLNGDLEEIQTKVKKLEEQVRSLQLKKR